MILTSELLATMSNNIALKAFPPDNIHNTQQSASYQSTCPITNMYVSYLDKVSFIGPEMSERALDIMA